MIVCTECDGLTKTIIFKMITEKGIEPSRLVEKYHQNDHKLFGVNK